jgi:hypothetical protein
VIEQDLKGTAGLKKNVSAQMPRRASVTESLV